ncbi:ATP-binding protein [Kiloniella sp. EL199]|uniref:ATP-binding protein n=1 Tax=Kiloniella sp. EL199 TaxID=2107581 RepID=UPI0013C483BB|nr:ATP-binding protein [Kiloniella sp. EL199]
MTLKNNTLNNWPLSRILVPLLAVTLIVVGVLATEYMRHYETKHMRLDADVKTREIGQLVASIATTAIITKDKVLLDNLIGRVSTSIPSIHRIVFLDGEGKQVKAWNKKALIERKYCMDHTIPIESQGKVYGSLKIRWNLVDDYQRIDSHIYGMMVQAGIILLVAASIFIIFGRFFVLTPMERINSHLSAIMQGSTRDDISFRGFVAKEFKDLANTLNLFSSLVKEREVSENKMKAIVDTAMDCIISIDAQGYVLDFNPASEKTFGFSANEAVGQKLSELIIPEELREMHEVGMKKYFETGEGPVLGKRIEVEALHKEGHVFPVELAIEDTAGPDGTIFVAYLRDITTRRAAEKELLNEKEKAEIASQTKSDFLAMMSHEIRTPLNGVVGILGLLDETKLNQDQKHYVNTGRNSAETLLTVINDILDFSKMEAGKLELENFSYDLHGLIDSVGEVSKPQADKSNLIFETVVSRQVPQWVESDPGRVRQVLLNLVSNALKFTKEGRVTVLVTADEQGAEDKGKTIRFEVQDTGLGIPENLHDDLFSEFTTVDASYARKFGGTGLGLSICKRLVEMMDGAIGFDSREGEGSHFWFEIPMKLGTAPIEENVGSQTAGQRMRVIAKNHKRLLLAEDNPTNVMVIKAILKNLGYKVDAVGNGKEAVDAVQNFPYDLVFMDVSMPEMDGLEATQKIRSLGGQASEVPIVAMTAHAMQGFREKVLEAGMDEYIRKPIRKERVIEVLDTFIEVMETAEKGENVVETALQSSDETEHLEDNNKSLISSDMDKPIDTSVLRRLANETDLSMMPELIDLFLEDAARRVLAISQATKQRDLETLELECHTLGSSAAAYGAMEMQSIAMEVEMLCQRVLNDAALETAARMPKVAEEVFAALRQYKQDKGWMVH